jgi:hypothetical protein
MFDWFNPDNITIFNLVDDDNQDGKVADVLSPVVGNDPQEDARKAALNGIYLQIPYTYNMLNEFSYNSRFGYISEINKVSEPIVRKENNLLTYKELNSNKLIINNLLLLSEKNTGDEEFIKLYSKLVIRQNISTFVIDNNFKCCGLMTNQNMFIPLKKYANLSAIPIKEIKSIIFIDAVNKLDRQIADKDIKEYYNANNIKFTEATGSKSIIFKDMDFVYLSTTEFNTHSLDSLVNIHNRHMNTLYMNDLYNVFMNLTNKEQEEIYYIKHEFNPMTETEKTDFMKKYLNVETDIAEGLFRLNDRLIRILHNKNKQLDDSLIIIQRNEIQNGKIIKLHDEHINPYKVFSTTYDDHVHKIKLATDVSLNESNLSQQIILHPGDKLSTITNTRLSILFGSSKNSIYNELKYQEQYTNNWIIDYFIQMSKIINNKSITSKEFFILVKKEIKTRFAGTDKVRNDMIKKLNGNSCFKDKKMATAADIIQVVEEQDYAISFFEFEVMREFMDMNIVIFGKGASENNNSSMLIGGGTHLLLSNTMSDYYAIIVYEKIKSETRGHMIDSFYPIVKIMTPDEDVTAQEKDKDSEIMYLYNLKDITAKQVLAEMKVNTINWNTRQKMYRIRLGIDEPDEQ